MNKKIYLLLTVLLAWSFNLKAQTAQIESLTANPGASVSFDITVGDIPTNVGAVSLFIGYDPNVLTFQGSTLGDADFAGYIINNMTGSNQVGIQWTDYDGADINGIILSLEFLYSPLGGTCELTFGPGCEFTNILLESIDVTYTNGEIGPNAGVATVTIDELQATAGPVFVGITGAGFNELPDPAVGAMTLFIDFDEDILQFASYTTTLTGLSLGVNNTTGVISVAYSNYQGESINETFLTLQFIYNATGTSELVFIGDCEIAYTNLTEPTVSYDNGLVEPLATAYSMTIGDVIATPGNVIGIPVTADGYNGPDDDNLMGAVTLYIGYDPAHLEFVYLTNGTLTGASANVVSPGLVGITWSSGTGALIDGTLLTLNFDYNFGASEITFEGGCEITDIGMNSYPTTFFDGSISPVIGGPEISLPTLTGTIGQAINFPITAKNFSMDVAAISLFIGYDDAVLAFTGSTPGTIEDYFINAMPNSQIGIQWSLPGGADIDPNDDDVLLTLHFIYNGGESELTFDAGCEFSQADLSFIPVAYFDGAVITGTFFNITAFLEGPYNGVGMNAYLNELELLPLAQPYNADPWNYTGTENVSEIPNADVVDWVLLEIRETTGGVESATATTTVAQQAAFILSDGSVVGLDGESDVLFPLSFNDNVYVVLYHRNHVRLMSSSALTMVNGTYVYDFTDNLTKAYGSFQKEIGTGVYGMYTGDIDNDGEVFSGDVSLLLNEYPVFGIYSNSDLDLDGEVFSGDVTFLLLNYPLFTYIP